MIASTAKLELDKSISVICYSEELYCSYARHFPIINQYTLMFLSVKLQTCKINPVFVCVYQVFHFQFINLELSEYLPLGGK
jgi:hypothetical protein